MDLVDIIESKRFLGGEFLTWLWFQSHRRNGRFDLDGLGPIELEFADQLVLDAFLAEAEQSRLSGGAPSYSPEAKTALRMGKRVSKAKLKLRREERDWVFTVTADDFHFGGVRVPATLQEPEEKTLDRFLLIEELDEVFTALYSQFLNQRLSDQWPQINQELEQWAHQDDS